MCWLAGLCVLSVCLNPDNDSMLSASQISACGSPGGLSQPLPASQSSGVGRFWHIFSQGGDGDLSQSSVPGNGSGEVCTCPVLSCVVLCYVMIFYDILCCPMLCFAVLHSV